MSRVPVWGAVVAAACTSTGSEGTSVEDDLAEYDGLVAELDGGRVEVVSGAAQDYVVAGSRLTYQDAQSGIPVLRAYDDATGDTISYEPQSYWPGTPGSPSDNMNFSASTGVVASMNTMDSLGAWDPASGDELGELVVPAPPYGQKWWAYTTDGDAAYVAVIADGHLVVQRWSPGEAQAHDVVAIDELVAPNALGEFTSFAVSGDTLMFYEGGRLWIASLSRAEAAWVQNDEYVGAVDFTDEDVVYSQGGRIFRYDRAADAREELTDRIVGAWSLNATYPEPHVPTADTTFTRAGDTLVYQGTFGLFAYDLADDEVRPVLLDHRDNSVVYRYPTAMAATGAVFAKGLESESGSVGADGPTWRVDL